jgi:propionate CoA-transferase
MRVVSAEQAVSYIHDGDTVLIGGSGGGHAVPEKLIAALETRFLEEGHPKSITTLHPVGLGDEDTQGVARLAHQDLLKRVVTGIFIDSPPIAQMAKEDQIEAYTLPQGALSQLMREMAAGRPGLITHVGLHTFVDPRYQGGRQSPSAKEELVELIELDGKEWLYFKPFHVDVTFLRGTTADEDGNISMEQEAIFGEMLSMAQATRRAGGVVIVQVRRLAKRGTLPPKQVIIPGMLVDLVVVDPNQWQTYLTEYSPAYAGELRVPLSEIERLEFNVRKVVARRAAMELYRDAICNLGAGISTGIANVAAEEEILDQIILTNEQGLIGGAPASGIEAGAATNYSAMVEQPYQFDFYDGGGLDLAFLSFAQIDPKGNVNVSKLGGTPNGPGGFINISHNAKKVVFSGTLTGGGLDVSLEGGEVQVNREGRYRKFVDELEQITYNAQVGLDRGQEIMYVTERAVFRGTTDGVQLVEIAPGLDLERDVIAKMDFRPLVADDLRDMDPRLFRESSMGLDRDLAERPPRPLPARLRESSKGDK